MKLLLLLLWLSLFSGAPAVLAAAGASTSVHPARVLATVEPVYPYLERRAGNAAEVTVGFTVDAGGRVTGAHVQESSNPALNAAALAAIRQWTFAPAQANGRPVSVRVRQTFVFSVRDRPEEKNGGSFAAGRNAR